MRGVVLLLAAGEGTRLGTSKPKAFLDLAGTPILRRAFEAIEGSELVDSVVVAAPAGFERRVESLVPGITKPVQVVTGGPTRQSSAAAALAVAPATDAFLVHDAARALAPSSLFDAVLRELDDCDAVCPARPVTDTIKEVDGATIVGTLDRSNLVAVETPQGVRAELYRRAHYAALADAFLGTDDLSLVERIGASVRIIPSADHNPKITHLSDVALAEALLAER